MLNLFQHLYPFALAKFMAVAFDLPPHPISQPFGHAVSLDSLRFVGSASVLKERVNLLSSVLKERTCAVFLLPREKGRMRGLSVRPS